MKKYAVLPLFIVILAAVSSAQSKSNETILKEIKAQRIEKTVSLSYDQSSNVSKLMAVTDNFDGVDRAGVQAMNFAIGFMYSGKELKTAPDNILLTFWVLTKKPRFVADHTFQLIGTEPLDLGSARYAAKPRENMEYLNFEISRENLGKIAEGTSGGRFRLGSSEMTFTRSQLKAISDILLLSDPSR